MVTVRGMPPQVTWTDDPWELLEPVFNAPGKLCDPSYQWHV